MYIDVYKYSSYSKRSDHSFYCKEIRMCKVFIFENENTNLTKDRNVKKKWTKKVTLIRTEYSVKFISRVALRFYSYIKNSK